MDSIADIAAALAAMPDHELHALRATIDGEPVIVPGLLAWLKAATDWEIGHRAGFQDELRGPPAAIDDGEVECSLVALAILHASFRNVQGVANFLDVTAAALCLDPDGPSRGVD